MLKNTDPMTFDDLSAIYRVEKKSRTISAVRKDLYPAMAGLIMGLRAEYEKYLSIDPDSIICEGVNQHRKKAVALSREITELRMEKIAALALIGARGGQNALEPLTPEERDYYDGVLIVSRKHIDMMDKLSGKRKFETPAIDPEPAEKKVPEPIQTKKEPAAVQTPEIAPVPEPAAEDLPEENMAKPPKDSLEEDGLVVIRILEDLPPFSGPDRNYELSKEDIVRMPKAMALALIKRDKAVMLNPGP
ncbi:MAG: hypothetical protein LBP82_03805 [Candidatus Methanoplasma sp.]|jgi:DNA replication factor GINS|nr:hypothetical protein [Candidatus Methanoplasma sp.]